MGDILSTIVKWSFRAGVVMAGILAFVLLLNFALGLIFVTLNYNVLSDMLAMIQMWLPFNLNTLLTWLVTVSALYVSYRLAVVAIAFVNKFIGEN